MRALILPTLGDLQDGRRRRRDPWPHPIHLGGPLTSHMTAFTVRVKCREARLDRSVPDLGAAGADPRWDALQSLALRTCFRRAPLAIPAPRYQAAGGSPVASLR
jgi:hypothetical protein